MVTKICSRKIYTTATKNYQREQKWKISDVIQNFEHDGLQFGIVVLVGSVRSHVFDDICQHSVHFSFLKIDKPGECHSQNTLQQNFVNRIF